MYDTMQSGRMEPRTITARVYKQIKDDIMRGVYPPGTHLVRRTLAKHYGVSSLPIMEACFRLESDGLVENSPMLGTHVVDINEEIVEEERKYREALECQVARHVAELAEDLDLQQLDVTARHLDSIQDGLDAKDEAKLNSFYEHHTLFHLSLAKVSRAKVIYRQMKKLWYRRQMIAGDVNAILFPVPHGWHIRLMDAIKSRDPDKAEQAMRTHLSYNKDKVDASVREVKNLGAAELIGRMTKNLLTES